MMKVPFLSFYDIYLVGQAPSSAVVNNLLHVSIERVVGPRAMPGHLSPMESSYWPFHDSDALLGWLW
jgi:hypothetical protein